MGTPQLYLGPAGSGAPPHYHRAAVNVLVYGAKHWYLLPPTSAVYRFRPPRTEPYGALYPTTQISPGP